MRWDIEIDCPVEQMERRRARMEARQRFDYIDRVPVGYCLVPRYFTPLFDLPYNQFFQDAETQYHWQLQFAKYRIERIPEDMFCTAPILTVYPYFDNVLDSHAMGAEIVWPENETLHALPTLHTVEEMERFVIPPPDSGLWGRLLDWCEQMRGFAEETRITFSGVEGRVAVAPPTVGGLSPHMIAVDLAGTDFYWWMLEYPEACHRFLEKITQALMQTQRFFEERWYRPRGAFGLAEDTAQILSPASFREFCVPYDRRLYETFCGKNGDRMMHMCGKSSHLHRSLVEDLKVTEFVLFGYVVPPKVAAENLGGKMRLWGNLNPMLLLEGTPEEVKAAALECLDALAPCGGLLLGDGANVCPGTPLRNLEEVTEAAKEFGLPKIEGLRRRK